MENEFMRFNAIFSIITGHAINEEVELQDMVKRLQERGIENYEPNEKDQNEVGNSPILSDVV